MTQVSERNLVPSDGTIGVDWRKSGRALVASLAMSADWLLFEVGLESTVAQMLSVGVTALIVAVVGVALPFALGWGSAPC